MPANPTTIRCPCCGRPRTPRAKPIRPAPLLDGIERDKAVEQGRRSVTTGAWLMLRHDLRDAASERRACIVISGRHLPLAFPSIPAALAALRSMKRAR